MSNGLIDGSKQDSRTDDNGLIDGLWNTSILCWKLSERWLAGSKFYLMISRNQLTFLPPPHLAFQCSSNQLVEFISLFTGLQVKYVQQFLGNTDNFRIAPNTDFFRILLLLLLYFTFWYLGGGVVVKCPNFVFLVKKDEGETCV